MRHFVASLFAFTGILSGRIAAGKMTTYRDAAEGSIKAGLEFCQAWKCSRSTEGEA